MRTRALGVLGLVALVLTAFTASAWAHHGPMTGHLPPTQANVDLVSRLQVSPIAPEWVADVATYRDTAFLAGWSPMCTDARVGNRGGFWSIDISNPAAPRQVAFTQSPPGTYLTEGMHAMRLTVPSFTGDVLIVSQEICGNAAATGRGGFAIYDVTNPATPTLLGASGDTGVRGPLFNSSHSAFGWDTGPNAYVAIVDNQEFDDIDIFDITDPRNPRLIRETGIDDWPAAQDNLAYGSQAFVHDLITRRVEGRWEMLASYWDAGYVRLDMTDPANPRYISDHDFLATEPLVPDVGRPEGNAHEAEWDRCPEEGVRSRFPCGEVSYVLAADEDFSVARPTYRVTTGPSAGFQDAGEFSWTVPLTTQFAATGGVAEGPTRFGGSGCPSDINGNGTVDRAEVPPASTLPAAPGEERIIVFERGTCFFSEKVETGQLAGYDVAIVGNHHAGAVGGTFPDAFLCGAQGHVYTPTIAGVCIGHRGMHQLFNDPVEYTTPSTGAAADLPPIGTVGANVRIAGGVFDGWGYLHLLDHDTMRELDQYSIPEAIDSRFVSGFGDLTIHEITTDPTGSVGYAAWYSGGLRVIDYDDGTLEEVGRFIQPEGADYWGVELNVRRDGRLFVLNSDRNYGLYIFRFGTDLQVRPTGRRTGRVGRALTWSVRVRNDGTIDETAAKHTLNVPRGMRAVAASASQGRCVVRRSVVRCNLGRLVEDGVARIRVRLMPTRAGVRRLSFFANGVRPEYDTGNNLTRARVTIRPAPRRAAQLGSLTGRPG
jgi:hypothetical protein